MVSRLKKTMEKYINDPENDYSVQDMIISLCSSDNGLSVFSTDESLRKATTVFEVFLFISQKCSMYDYEVLKIYVNSTDCEEAIQILEDFTTELENSLLKYLNLLSDDDLNYKSSIFCLPSGKKRKLTIECIGTNLKCEDKNLIQNIIYEKFGLPPASLQFIAVTDGSVNLIFEMSLIVKEHLLCHKITTVDVSLFIQYWINRLIIDDELELKSSAGYASKVITYM